MPRIPDQPEGARLSIPPALAFEVPRPSIDRTLSGALSLPLTLVTAGAGWGKTTAVARWARQQQERGTAIAWLTLRRQDDSPSMFWGAVLTAVRGSGAVPDGHPLAVLSTEGGVNDEVRFALFRGMTALREPLVLVLDDFHLMTNDDVLSVVADLVSRRTQLHVVLLTRVDPPLPLHRLRLSGVLVEVSASDLAFDADAVRRLAAAAESLELSGSGLDEVLARTEGWPAGVRLATMYLARDGASVGLEGFGGTDRSVAEYLMAEVLLRNGPDVRDFLLRTSVVELVSGDLADAIVPGGQGHARLKALAQANQFIAPVDHERTVFRYHPLLRDLLLHRLQLDDAVAFREAHRAAAAWFLTQQKPVRAMGHAAAAEAWDLVAKAFFAASPALVGAHGATVVENLRAIPFEYLPPSAAFETCAAALAYGEGHFFGVEAHVEEARRLLARGDRLAPVALALLDNFTCVAGRARGDEAAVAEAAVAALKHVSEAPPGPAAEGMGLIAMTQHAVALIRSGEVTAARQRLTTVVRDTARDDMGLMLLGARAHLSWCDLVEGDLSSAVPHASEVIDDAVLRGWASQLQIRPAYMSLAIARSLQGEFTEAERWVAAGLAADANGVEVWPTLVLRLAQASVAVARSRPRAAVAALASAREAARDRPESPSLVDTLTRVAAEVAMLSGADDESLALDELDELDELDVPRATAWSTRARLALARGDVDGALLAAGRVPRPTESTKLDDQVAAIEAAICEALSASQQGRAMHASHCMAEALSLAAPHGILRPFLVPDSGGVERVLRTTRTVGAVEALRTSALDRLAGTSAGESASVEPEPVLEPLTERELAVLAELPTMRTNEEIAEDFFVSINTVKSHLTHLYRKLGVGNRRDAVRRARELGLLH